MSATRQQMDGAVGVSSGQQPTESLNARLDCHWDVVRGRVYLRYGGRAIWIDCEIESGKDMRDRDAASSARFNGAAASKFLFGGLLAYGERRAAVEHAREIRHGEQLRMERKVLGALCKLGVPEERWGDVFSRLSRETLCLLDRVEPAELLGMTDECAEALLQEVAASAGVLGGGSR